MKINVMNVLHFNESKDGVFVKTLGNKKFDNFIEMTLWLKDNGFEKNNDGSKMTSFYKVKKNGNVLHAHIVR